jgi:GH15 family glucan-1,4-alpha-glucosidase
MIGDIGVILPLGHAAAERLERTRNWWQDWSRKCAYQGRYRDAVIRSALTLKLLSYCLSGAILAAPTTSLPEIIGGEANWDYRYCWLRDAGLTMQALVGLGFDREARAFLGWLLHATRLTWPELRVLYDVYGRAPAHERVLGHLEGYCRSRPVRLGNGAAAQLQLDVYGEVILAADAFVAGGGTLDPAESRMLAGLGEVVCRQWRRPDHSIWEIRGAPRHYTFSKVMCWLALDRLLTLKEKGIVRIRPATEEHFRRERSAIAEAIEQRGFNGKIGSYVSELDGGQVDTSLLLMVCLGYKDATDPRMVSTYDCIMRRLEHRGLLYRYELGSDSREGKEGAFGLSGFWAVDNLAKRGALVQAERQFSYLFFFANDLGLFAEEIDPETGAALGNFPQGFTHIGLINAALALDQAQSSRGAAHD